MKDIFDFIFMMILDVVGLFVEIFTEYKYVFIPVLVALGSFVLYEVIKIIRNALYK